MPSDQIVRIFIDMHGHTDELVVDRTVTDALGIAAPSGRLLLIDRDVEKRQLNDRLLVTGLFRAIGKEVACPACLREFALRGQMPAVLPETMRRRHVPDWYWRTGRHLKRSAEWHKARRMRSATQKGREFLHLTYDDRARAVLSGLPREVFDLWWRETVLMQGWPWPFGGRRRMEASQEQAWQQVLGGCPWPLWLKRRWRLMHCAFSSVSWHADPTGAAPGLPPSDVAEPSWSRSADVWACERQPDGTLGLIAGHRRLRERWQSMNEAERAEWRVWLWVASPAQGPALTAREARTAGGIKRVHRREEQRRGR